MSNLRYTGGTTTYLEVLGGQRSPFSAELTLAQARGTEYQSLVQLYRFTRQRLAGAVLKLQGRRSTKQYFSYKIRRSQCRNFPVNSLLSKNTKGAQIVRNPLSYGVAVNTASQERGNSLDSSLLTAEKGSLVTAPTARSFETSQLA
jgi:hypothetical protein